MAVIWAESDGNRLQLERFAGFCTKRFSAQSSCYLPPFSPCCSSSTYSQRGSQSKTGNEAERPTGRVEAAQLAELGATRASEKQENRGLCQRELRR